MLNSSAVLPVASLISVSDRKSSRCGAGAGAGTGAGPGAGAGAGAFCCANRRLYSSSMVSAIVSPLSEEIKSLAAGLAADVLVLEPVLAHDLPALPPGRNLDVLRPEVRVDVSLQRVIAEVLDPGVLLGITAAEGPQVWSRQRRATLVAFRCL